MSLVTSCDGSAAAREDSDCFPTRYDFTAKVPYHTPLLHSLRECLPQNVQENMPKGWLDSSDDVECFEGQAKASLESN